MSGNGEEEKTEPGKAFPLDLAAKITTVKAVDGKTPLIMTGQALRGMRVLTPASSVPTSANIITTNMLTQAVVKQQGGDVSRSQVTNMISTTQTQPQASASIIQRPSAQITLTTTLPVVAQSPTGTYHVPRGPAVVANLAAPRSNVATAIRSPMIVNTQTSNQQAQNFVRPPRTPSPAQGTAWLTTNSSNGSQIKGAPTVLSSPVRGASVTGVNAIGKPQIVARTQPVTQTVSTIRPAATILHSAITIGQGAQLHPFKPGQNATGIQALSANTVTLAQVLPSRTQTLVYSSGGNTAHLAAVPRITVSNNVQNQRQITTPKTMGQVTTTRLTMPVNVTPATRLVTPQGAVLTTGTRMSTTSTPQQTAVLGSTAPARIVSTTQSTMTIGRISMTVANPAQSGTSTVIGQNRISTLSLHPLVAVANTTQARTIQTQGAKVITQPAQGAAIHLAQMPATIKPTQTIVTTAARTINVQPIVSQRTVTPVSSQAIPIAKVFPQQGESQQVVTPSANVFIHAQQVASVPRRSSPGPTNAATATSVVTTTVATYSIAGGTYFYDASGTYSVGHSFSQPSSFTAVPQSTSQQIKQPTLATQVHGIVTNQQMRFNPVMVLEQNRSSQYSQSQQQQQQEQNQEQLPPAPQVMPTQTQKVTSSPRPSILRKRDHEGSPLKAVKNLNTSLASSLPQQNSQPPISPPSRPDSGGNGNSSGGSTTVSATSSPGVAETNEDSMPHVPAPTKEEEENNRPPTEMSPRKKPRKQQFGTGSNDIDENLNDDMQFITENAIKKEQDSDENRSDFKEEPPEPPRVVRKPASASLLNSYRQTWKATQNHYLRYSDVRPKDERRPTIMDLANQCRVLDKVNGWKIHHLSTQMEDLADQEQAVYNQLTKLLKCTEAEEKNSNEKEINHINELIKGNLQRIKIINDGMMEAKTQIMKIFDHKMHVTDIISRCASKRNFKKREKS